MDVHEAIERRGSYGAIEVTNELTRDLAYHTSLAPSCYNNQLISLGNVFEALSPGNGWVRSAPLVIAVYSRRDYDCVEGAWNTTYSTSGSRWVS